MSTISSPITVIGIGNEYRGDDGAGLVVCRLLKPKNFPGTSVIECDGDGADLLELWKNAGKVFLIDAVSSGSRPGAIFRFDALKESIPLSYSFHSTHAFGIAEALGLARVLHQLPPFLVIYAIEGKSFTAGSKLSEEVEKAIQQVVDLVACEIQSAYKQA